jgi:uncharacterized protein YdhG (YjbR/CyaY superfamily)
VDPATVDDYLAALPPEPRRVLEGLRRTIRAAAPEAVEALYYRMPAFRHHGRALVAYAAFKDHCSLFPLSPQVIESHAAELSAYHTTKGTIRFTPDRPLPASLVERLVGSRLAELAERRGP